MNLFCLFPCEECSLRTMPIFIITNMLTNSKNFKLIAIIFPNFHTKILKLFSSPLIQMIRMSHLSLFKVKMHIKLFIWSCYDSIWSIYIFENLLTYCRQVSQCNVLYKLYQCNKFDIFKFLYRKFFQYVEIVKVYH